MRVGGFLRVAGIALVLAAPSSMRAQEIAVREGEESSRTKLLMIPYVFYNDTIGMSVSATVGRQGFPQEQSSLWGSGVLASLEQDLGAVELQTAHSEGGH